MPGCEDPTIVRRDTEKYWKALQDNPDQTIQLLREQYIPKILMAEMDCLEKPRDEEVDSCKALVFLVGHSLEPLLQSICAYQPEQVFLVHNQAYGSDLTGDDHVSTAKKLIAILPDSLIVKSPAVECIPLNGDKPGDVYRALQQTIKSTSGLVIDITGAKKSMIAGAYLFAALAEIPISYVDFPDAAYVAKSRRPYGYKARIGQLPNPFENFALGSWERVRGWYERYKFRDALDALGGDPAGESTGASGPTILEKVIRFLPEFETPVRNLAAVLKCYELWDWGDYEGALTAAKEAAARVEGFEPPPGVSRLGQRWVKIDGIEFKPPPDFYADESMLQAYACDELARIRRLCDYNRDYRSAFLRAAGLNEVVMTARLVKAGVEESRRRQESEKLVEAETPGAFKAFDHLIRGSSFSFKPRRGNFEISFRLSSRMAPWWTGIEDNAYNISDGWKTFLIHRNKLAHTFVSIPEDWAKDAYAFVEANIKDFWPGAIENHPAETLTWPDVCKLCGLDKLLPPQLLRAAIEKKEPGAAHD